MDVLHILQGIDYWEEVALTYLITVGVIADTPTGRIREKYSSENSGVNFKRQNEERGQT